MDKQNDKMVCGWRDESRPRGQEEEDDKRLEEGICEEMRD